MSAQKKRTPKSINGPAILAAMFRELDPPFRDKLRAKLLVVSPIIARLVEHLEFQFNDLGRLEDRSIQIILRMIAMDQWLIAWKLADERLKKAFLTNMSDRQREDFLAQFAKLPRMPKAQVYRVQMQITAKAFELLGQGQLRIKSRRPLQEIQEKLRQRQAMASRGRPSAKPKKSA